MEVAFDVEDDVFFADLSKQISLLIMDDDEEDSFPCPPVSLQAMSQAIHGPATQASILYEQSCRRESKGTGVFIPCSSQNPRRKNRKGNNNPSNYHRQLETVRGIKQVTCKNTTLSDSFSRR